MDKKPVICPWCGSEMSPAAYETEYEKFVGYYVCLECNCESPCVIDCKDYDDAIAQAYQRAISHPLGKPMTWEQVKQWQHDWIFVEFHLGDVFAMMPYINKFQPMTLDVYVFDKEGYETYGPYGDGFRCWDHYPTDEERNAAPWNP